MVSEPQTKLCNTSVKLLQSLCCPLDDVAVLQKNRKLQYIHMQVQSYLLHYIFSSKKCCVQ